MNVMSYQEPAGFPPGARMMVLLDSDGSSLWADAATTNLVAALVAWRRATTDELRRKLLTKWKNGKPGTLQSSAAARLARLESQGAAPAATSAPCGAAAPTSPAARPRWSVADVTWRSPGSAKAAEKRVAALWPAMLDGAGARLGRFAAMTSPVECAQWASLMTAKQAAMQVRDTVGDSLDPSALGSLAALDALGNTAVWSVTCEHGCDSLFAYVRASDGALVMVWLPPAAPR
jgi:hypothetical protein